MYRYRTYLFLVVSSRGVDTILYRDKSSLFFIASSRGVDMITVHEVSATDQRGRGVNQGQ